MSACIPKRRINGRNRDSNKSSTNSLRSLKTCRDSNMSNQSRFSVDSLNAPKIHPSTRSRLKTRFQLTAAPSISKNPRMWFDYYDKDRNNGLSRQELIDALLEFSDIKDASRRQKFLQNIKRLWEEYDTDYIGQIGKSEFLKKGGLAERIMVFEKMKIQNQIQMKVDINGRMKPNDTIKIISPRNRLPMACSIPEVNEWRTLNGKSFFFVVTV